MLHEYFSALDTETAERGCGSGRARDDEPVASAGTGDMDSGN